ncbi:MAG: hypothetical protein ACRD0B_00490 [Acidimicrobiales bacterium]
MSGREWSAEERRTYAVARSMERTRAELAPVRQQISDLIDEIGWRSARPVVQRAVGRPIERRGIWLLGKRETHRALEALRSPALGQLSFFDHDDGPSAA